MKYRNSEVGKYHSLLPKHVQDELVHSSRIGEPGSVIRIVAINHAAAQAKRESPERFRPDVVAVTQ